MNDDSWHAVASGINLVEGVDVERRLREAGHATSAKIGKNGAWFCAAVAAFMAYPLIHGQRVFAASVAFWSGYAVFCLALWLVARRRPVDGWAAWALMALFVSIPSLYIVGLGIAEPDGLAAGLDGGMIFAYALQVTVTVFYWRPLLTFAAGILAAAELLVLHRLALSVLTTVHAPSLLLDVVLHQDEVWYQRAATLAMIGSAAAGASMVSSILIRRLIGEERHRLHVDKTFGQYVSPEVKDAILSNPNRSRGQRRRAAVLFSDLRGFSTFSEGRDPESVVEHLNQYLERMVEAIVSEGGVVDKFIGDAVMATFGGVNEIASASSAALRAARQMRRALAELNAEWRGHQGASFENGIGIHFGEVIVGPIGSRQRREFTTIGDTVNVAARVEGLTKGSGGADPGHRRALRSALARRASNLAAAWGNGGQRPSGSGPALRRRGSDSDQLTLRSAAFSHQSVLLVLQGEGADRHADQRGRAGLHAAGRASASIMRLPLQLAQLVGDRTQSLRRSASGALRHSARSAPRPPCALGQVPGLEAGLARRRRRVLHRVLELAHVAGPRGSARSAASRPRDDASSPHAWPRAHASSRNARASSDDLARPLAQRRQHHRGAAEPEVQILGGSGPALTSASRSRLVAATTRTSTSRSLVAAERA